MDCWDVHFSAIDVSTVITYGHNSRLGGEKAAWYCWTGTWYYGRGCSTICMATLAAPWLASWQMLWPTACAEWYKIVFHIRLLWDVGLCASSVTGCECQITTLGTKKKIPRINWPMTEVPGSNSTERCRTKTIQTQGLRSPGRRFKNISPSKGSGCFIVARKCGTFYIWCGWSSPEVLSTSIWEWRKLWFFGVGRRDAW